MTTSLTAYEMQLVTDAQILITKNTIIRKVYGLFGKLSEEYREEVNCKIAGQNLISPKISRGENYLGLPYVILDYPRQFAKDDVFAIRSFFWWGNFFSITLHLSGSYLKQYSATIESAIKNRLFQEWHIAVGDSQWEHHFEINNYMPLEDENYEPAQLPFLKLATKIPLEKWDDVNTFFTENFKLLLNILHSYAPIR